MITDAKKRIAGYVKRTPLKRSESLSKYLGTNVFVKYELFQRTGSFKVRGAFNKMLGLSDDDVSCGVVAVSGGNHAQAVAYAANVLDIKSVILMPENTPKIYVEATRGYGATLDLRPTIAEAFAAIEQYAAEGKVFVHPFDDPMVIAGQGTVGLEIMEDVPDATDVIVSIGGGGLANGVAIAMKSVNPAVKAWGVERSGPTRWPRRLAAGKVVELAAITSIAKTLGAPAVSERTLELTRKYLESVTVVPDSEAVDAMVLILERLKVITEPASSCTVAAAKRLGGNFGADSR